MPQPSNAQVHIDAPLTNISVAYFQAAENFISNKVFPEVHVKKKSDLYFIYNKNDFFRSQAQVRAPGTESAGTGYNLSTGSYSCLTNALHKDVSDEIRENEDDPLNSDRDSVLFLTAQMILKQEIDWHAANFVTGVWGTTITPGNLWSNYATSDPISDVKTGRKTILTNTGRLPNTLTLGYNVHETLINHPDIVDRVKFTGQEVVTDAALAKVLGVERILVSMATNATNAENATAVYALAGGDNALLCYSAPNPGLQVPSAGYTFVWDGVSGGMGKNLAVKQFRMEKLASDRFEVSSSYSQKIVGTDLGYLFLAVL